MDAAGTLRVLVVDDCRDAADSLGLLVGLWGHAAFVAYSGQGALELAAITRPHVVLLDLALPSMSGFDVASQLRERPELGGMVLIAVTGLSDVATRSRALESSIEHVLVKPVDPVDLERLLAEIASQVLVKTAPPTKKTRKMPALKRDCSKAAKPPQTPNA
jgi:CheY-like chemotaxis protein